jgi:nucleotide-binding universal stress UspA family protein
LSRVAFGSTAECIVRHAHCPVLTVRRKMDPAAKRLLALRQPLYPKQMPWRRILVPLDFSLTSLRALKVAVPLAQQYGARLQLLNVVEPHPYPVGMEGAVLVIPERTLAKAARRQLLRIARKFIPRSVRTTCLVAQGRAASLIVETAEAERADMIVLGTHGRTGFAWSLMGSTAERVVRHAKCPVFVVRNPRTRRTAANALRN